ncbi:hypothetical protein XENORESO_009389, partial [Xenotaenia resolanae]
DALTEVLTKVNRMDIVTLLEGPIFDYGNISGTRCFADDNAVFRDQADGWHSDSSSVNVEPPTPGRSVSSDLLDKQESQENSSESITSSSRAESGRSRPNGNNSKHSPQDASSDSSTGRKDGTLLSEKKIQVMFIKGEEAKNIPGESMTEEHYMDHDGNLISRKVMYNIHSNVSFIYVDQKRVVHVFFLRKQESSDHFYHCQHPFCLEQVIRRVIRRVSTPTPENQGSESWHSDLHHSPTQQEYGSEVGMKTTFLLSFHKV